jgi:hypothetical protein
MSLEDAYALLAHEEGMDLSKYLALPDLDRIRRLADERARRGAQDVPQARATAPTKKTVKVNICGELKLSDPILPQRVLQDAREMTQVYAQLYVFENSIREVISMALLAARGAGWWDTCVPTKIRNEVDRRLQDEEKNPWHGKRGVHRIYYTDMADLASIIVKNWSHFAHLFPEQAWVTQKITEIARSRNTVNHHNPLSKSDRDRVHFYVRDWLAQIEAKKDKLV